MKTIILALAVAGAFTTAAAAQNWTINRTQTGNFGYSNGYDNQGNTVTGTHQRLGNTQYDNYYDNQGNSMTCTTSRLGNSNYTNCY